MDGRLRRLVVWGEAFAAFFGGAVVFFCMPIHQRDVSTGLIWRGLLLFLALSLLTSVMVKQARRSTRAASLPAEQIALLLSIVDLVVVLFALLYYARAGEFSGLANRMDALYFTVSTLCTVGYGDIVPVTSQARGLVTVQMIFDLVIVTSLITIMLARRSGRPPASGDGRSR